MQRATAGSGGSSTVVITNPAEREAGTTINRILVLKLREKQGKKVKWTEDTVDNEFLNKKSSKRKSS